MRREMECFVIMALAALSLGAHGGVSVVPSGGAHFGGGGGHFGGSGFTGGPSRPMTGGVVPGGGLRPATTVTPLAPPSGRTTIIANPGFVNQINRNVFFETTPGFFYWDLWFGFPYCHYYDTYGVNWYGFHNGPDFYWTRYYNGYWWWWDPTYGRWLYASEGNWWYPAPDGSLYAYSDRGYTPHVGGAAAPAAPASGQSVTSPDRRRQVQVAGQPPQAFLYDLDARARPTFHKALARDVVRARFSGASGRTVLRLDLQDGSVALYDEDGKPLPAAKGQP